MPPAIVPGIEIAVMKASVLTIAGLIGVAGLAGCTPPPSVQPATAAPTVSWDGTYRGAIQITGVGQGLDRRWCQTDSQMIVQVSNNSFTYARSYPNVPNNPKATYSTTIAADGTFSSTIGTGVMSGQVAGSHMAGVINGSVCVYSFAADRS